MLESEGATELTSDVLSNLAPPLEPVLDEESSEGRGGRTWGSRSGPSSGTVRIFETSGLQASLSRLPRFPDFERDIGLTTPK
jgi:hypothetical protein